MSNDASRLKIVTVPVENATFVEPKAAIKGAVTGLTRVQGPDCAASQSLATPATCKRCHLAAKGDFDYRPFDKSIYNRFATQQQAYSFLSFSKIRLFASW